MNSNNRLADIGVVGLAVMGQNLALNMNDTGFMFAVYNRTASKVDDFMCGPAKDTLIIACHKLKSFIEALQTLRRVMLMVKAGNAVEFSFVRSMHRVGSSYLFVSTRCCHPPANF